MDNRIIKDNRYDNITTYDTPAYAPRKRRWGDRREGRRIRTLPGMTAVMPFIMTERNDAQNFFEDAIDITNLEQYISKKHKEGYTDLSLLHVLATAYARVVAERPGVNRFLAGRRIFARKNVECVLVIKKELSLEAPDSCVKIQIDPRDNVYNVYKKFQTTVINTIESPSDFDKVANTLAKLPRPILRGIVAFLKWMDFHGCLPKALLKVSPFHGSVIFTSMGSLGIPPIYHHLYNFGTLPLFISYGNVFTADAIKRDGTRERHHFITIKVVTDERVCDGYYYASAFKRIKRYLLHPESLDNTLENVVEDID